MGEREREREEGRERERERGEREGKRGREGEIMIFNHHMKNRVNFTLHNDVLL